MRQTNSALVRKDYDGLPREAKKTNDSTFDRIYKYYHNSKTRIELSELENKIRERWEKAWLLLCRHRTQKEVVDILTKLFPIGKSVAYDDMRNAMTLFGNPQDDLKDAKRAIAENMALRGADKAWKEGDLTMYHKFLESYRDLNGLTGDKDTSMGDLLKKMKPQQIIIVAKADELKAEAEALQEELTKDIDFETVE